MEKKLLMVFTGLGEKTTSSKRLLGRDHYLTKVITDEFENKLNLRINYLSFPYHTTVFNFKSMRGQISEEKIIKFADYLNQLIKGKDLLIHITTHKKPDVLTLYTPDIIIYYNKNTPIGLLDLIYYTGLRNEKIVTAINCQEDTVTKDGIIFAVEDEPAFSIGISIMRNSGNTQDIQRCLLEIIEEIQEYIPDSKELNKCKEKQVRKTK